MGGGGEVNVGRVEIFAYAIRLPFSRPRETSTNHEKLRYRSVARFHRILDGYLVRLRSFDWKHDMPSAPPPPIARRTPLPVTPASMLDVPQPPATYEFVEFVRESVIDVVPPMDEMALHLRVIRVRTDRRNAGRNTAYMRGLDRELMVISIMPIS